jgi:hypothetical protein
MCDYAQQYLIMKPFPGELKINLPNRITVRGSQVYDELLKMCFVLWKHAMAGETNTGVKRIHISACKGNKCCYSMGV